jgi:hypothetical protein
MVLSYCSSILVLIHHHLHTYIMPARIIDCVIIRELERCITIGFEPDSLDYEPKKRLRQSIALSSIIWLSLPLLYSLAVQLTCRSHMYVPDDAFVFGRVDNHEELESVLSSCESDVFWLIRCAYHIIGILHHHHRCCCPRSITDNMYELFM